MRRPIQLLALGVVTAALAACGGGGGASASLRGLAATGAALAGASVAAKCASGPTITGTTAADGSFNLSLSGGQTVPCMLEVTGGTPAVTLHSITNAAGRVNLTPLSELAVARALGSDPAGAFAAFDGATGATILAGIAAAKAYVAAQVNAITGRAPAADILNGVFAVGDADDQVLDALGTAISGAGKSLDDLRTAAAGGNDLSAALSGGGGGGGGGGGQVAAGSAVGTGLYTAVTAQDNSAFLSMLGTACTTQQDLGGGAKTYSRCTQNSSSFAVNLAANMWMGGLPHQTGGEIVSGPTSVSPGTAAITSSSLPGASVGQSCTVRIVEPFIPLVSIQVNGSSFYSGASLNFSFRGTAEDTVSVSASGVVFEYTMTNGQGQKLEMHPNIALFGGNDTGSEGIVQDLTTFNFFICR